MIITGHQASLLESAPATQQEKIERPSSRRRVIQRGLECRRILCILVQEWVQPTVQPDKATLIIPTVSATHWYTGGTVLEVSCDCHRFFDSASVGDCCSIQRTPEVKSSPRAGGTLPYLQAVHMDSACLSV